MASQVYGIKFLQQMGIMWGVGERPWLYLYSDLLGCVPLPQRGSVCLGRVKVNCDPVRYAYLICAGIASADGASAVIHLVRYTSTLQTTSCSEKRTHHNVIRDGTLYFDTRKFYHGAILTGQ